MSFAVDLRRFADKAKERADEVVGTTVFALAAELDRRSPVGDPTYWVNEPPRGYVGGRFRANWQLGVDIRPEGERNAVDPNGTIALPAIEAAIPDEAAGRVYYLSNNVPYAQRIELGWSGQAPQGLVGLTAQTFQEKVNRAVDLAS